MKRIRLLLVLMLLITVLPVRANGAGEDLAAGGIHILKTDVTGTPLEGASFELYRQLQEGELTDNDVKKGVLKLEDEHRIMAQESFWTTRNMEG